MTLTAAIRDLASRRSGKASTRTLRVLLWRFLGAGLAFVSTAAVTRIFGARTAGIYFLAITLSSIVITVSRLGLDLPTMRLVSTAGSITGSASERSVMKEAVRLAGIVALGLTAAMYVSAPYLSSVFGEPDLTSMVRLTSLGVLPAVMVVLFARGLIGVGRAELAEFGQRAGFQFVFLGLLFALVPSLRQLAPGAAFALAQGVMLALLTGAWFHSTTRSGAHADSRALRAELTSSGLPLLVAATMNLIVAWSDSLMLGYLIDSTAVGLYSAAVRVATVVSFVLIATGSIAGPKFADLLESKDFDGLERVFRRASWGSGLAALAIAVPLFALAPVILAIFGEGFPKVTSTLRLLIAAQFLHSAAGLVGLLLAMAKRERRLLSATVLSAGLNILLNTLLIPRYGTLGAAASTTVALLTLNGVSTFWVYQDLGLSIFKRLNTKDS